MFLKLFKRKEPKPKVEFKGVAPKIMPGFYFKVSGYYCPNCYYGVWNYQNDFKSGIKKCPRCNIKLDWDSVDYGG